MVEHSALVIDDDIWMQRILSKTLQSYGFNKIYLASNGYEGINLAIEHLPEIIILDILMPDLSGHQTLKLLKSIKKTKNIPVLIVSALSDTENLGRAVKYGVSGFITKPFTRTTIFDKLVGIFGTDRMEKIVAGLPIESLTSKDEELEIPTLKDELQEKTTEELDTSETIPAAQAEKAAESYRQADERTNIDAIKKLLLKTKKK